MTHIYLQHYTGYVYIWFDRKRKMFYIGSHYGSVEDRYICSNNWMKAAYKKRPDDFSMRVLEHDYGDINKCYGRL